eukprot:UN17095
MLKYKKIRSPHSLALLTSMPSEAATGISTWCCCWICWLYNIIGHDGLDQER